MGQETEMSGIACNVGANLPLSFPNVGRRKLNNVTKNEQVTCLAGPMSVRLRMERDNNQ